MRSSPDSAAATATVHRSATPAATPPTWLTIVRVIVALAIAAAVLSQVLMSLSFWTARGDESIPLDLLNFFSFFTIESNLLAMVSLAALAVIAVRRRPVTRGWHVLALCATTSMVTTGIVYNILLRGIELPKGATLGWSNEILHLVAPVWMLADWLLTSRERDVRWVDAAIVAIYPVAWLAYTLVRGPVAPDQATGDGSWYPYPFLDPADGGYGPVIITCAVIAATIVLLSLALIARARLRLARPSTAARTVAGG